MQDNKYDYQRYVKDVERIGEINAILDKERRKIYIEEFNKLLTRTGEFEKKLLSNEAEVKKAIELDRAGHHSMYEMNRHERRKALALNKNLHKKKKS